MLLAIAIVGLVLGGGVTAAAELPPELWTRPKSCGYRGCLQATVHSRRIGSSPADPVRLYLPDRDGTSYPVDALFDRSDDLHGTRVWQGHIVGDDFSNVTFVSVAGDSIIGLITTATDGGFRVRPMGRGGVIVQRVDKAAKPTDLDFRKTDIGERCAQNLEIVAEVACDHDAVVSVLVVTTPRARRWARDSAELEAWIRLAESRTNLSFDQSGVRHHIEVIGVRKLTRFPGGGDLSHTHDQLVMGENGLAEAREFRDGAGADIVVLVDNPTEGVGYGCQLRSRDGNRWPLSVAPFAAVSINSLSTYDVFTHELGHMLGAGHFQDATNPGAFNHSQGYYADVGHFPRWKSLMIRGGSRTSGCWNILYWSNSIREFTGPGKQSMGTAAEYDNAATLNETMCAVANLKE